MRALIWKHRTKNENEQKCGAATGFIWLSLENFTEAWIHCSLDVVDTRKISFKFEWKESGFTQSFKYMNKCELLSLSYSKLHNGIQGIISVYVCAEIYIKGRLVKVWRSELMSEDLIEVA